MSDTVSSTISQAEGRLVNRLGVMSASLRAMFDDNGRRIVENEAIIDRTARMEGEAERALDAYAKEIAGAADPYVRALADAEARLKEAESADPMLALTPTDAARASALRDSAAEAATSMALADLSSRLRGLARDKDRAAAVVYYAEGTKRLKRQREESVKAGHLLQMDPSIDDLERALAGLEPIALGAELVARRIRLRAEVQKNENILTRFGNAVGKWDGREIRGRFGLDRGPLWERLFEKADIPGRVGFPAPPGTY